MIAALTLLLVCQLIGETVARGLNIPVPGPVIGMALLFVILVIRARLNPTATPLGETALGGTARGLLANLSLLFVPAGVGILQHAGAMAAHGPALIVALIGSTAITLVVTALVFRALAKPLEPDESSRAAKGADQ